MRYLGSIAGGLHAPVGVAANLQEVAIADTGHHQLVIVAGVSGAMVRLGAGGVSSMAEGFTLPGAVTYASANRIFVADTMNRHLDQYDRTGGTWAWTRSLTGFTQLPQAPGPLTDLAMDGAGAVFALDTRERRVLRLDIATGAATVHSTDPEWVEPSAIAVGGSRLWIADAERHCVYGYAAGSPRVVVGSYGSQLGQLRAPRGIAVDTGTSRLYVAECDGQRISVFDFAGQSLGAVALPTHARAQRLAIASGTLYVADEALNCVHRIDLAAAVEDPRLSRIAFMYGAVGIGYRLSLSTAILNETSANLEVTSITVNGPGFSLEPSSPSPSAASPLNLAPSGRSEVRVRFAPVTSGPAFGWLRIETRAPAAPVLFAELAGQGVAVEPLALALVLDRSGSMNQSSGAMTKMERLRSACGVLLDLLALQGANELTIVPFSTSASVAMPRAFTTSTTLATAQQTVSTLNAGGLTAIGAGLQLALGELAGSAIPAQRVIVFTDGMENRPPPVANVAVSAGTVVFAIGLGLPQYIDVAKLARIASSSGGYLQVTDGADHMLPKFFTQILSDLVGKQTVLDPPITVSGAGPRVIPVNVSGSEHDLTCILTWERGESVLDLSLRTPRGILIPPSGGATVLRHDRSLVVHLPLQGSRWQESGRWTIEVTAPKLASGATESAVLTVIASADDHLHWEFGAIREEECSAPRSPKRSVPEVLEPPTYPPRYSPSRGPVDLRRGDALWLNVRALMADSGLKFTRGVVSVVPPGVSLADAILKRRVDPKQLDDVRLDEKPVHGKAWRGRLAVSKAKDHAQVVIPLHGPDGIYSIRAVMHARNASGEVLQRERWIQVVVS